MKKPKCPQCHINRFYVKNVNDENLLVSVNDQGEIVPVREGESTAGFDLTRLYCLGCSWKGSAGIVV